MSKLEDNVLNNLTIADVVRVQDHDYDRFILILYLLGWRPVDLAATLNLTHQAVSATIKKCKQRAIARLGENQ